MKYTVIEEFELGTLIEKVNEKIDEGWKPQGGIASESYIFKNPREGYDESLRDYYCQALVRED